MSMVLNISRLRLTVQKQNPLNLLTVMVFLGALLSFGMEPLTGRILVPHFGGAIHVWLTCVMFFQAVLLSGYLYSHFFVRKVGKWHLLLLFLPFLNLPFQLNQVTNFESPLYKLVFLLFSEFALPFFVLSTTAVIAQVWLSTSEVGKDQNPYTLYAASNAGSFVGLFGYPLVIEPLIGVRMQSLMWAAGYFVYGILVIWVWVSMKPLKSNYMDIDREKITVRSSKPKTKDYFIWLVLSCLPSALFLSVTNYIALEIGSFSLIWITPLALYLSSYIITFKNNGGIPKFVNLFWIEIILSGMIVYLLPLNHWFHIIIHLFILLVICILCHGELYNKRPNVSYLTHFYITIAVGGWLGGIFVSIVAPNLFSGLYEYPIIILSVGMTFLALHFIKLRKFWKNVHIFVAGSRILPIALMLTVIGIGIKANLMSETKFRYRNFYGTYKIRDIESSSMSTEPMRELIHGATLHGSQFIGKESQHIPTSYYYIGGNIEKVYNILETPRKIAVLGLGAGTTAAYGRTGDIITYFEIDPDNEKIARSWFTYLQDSKAKIKIITGDGRIALQKKIKGHDLFNLIHMDAFTGDGIPTHLLTKEAIQTYLNRLAENGIILFHISNRYYDLAPIIEKTAEKLNLNSVQSPEIKNTTLEWSNPSICVAVSRKKEALLPLIESGWLNIDNKIINESKITPWTDDYINVLSPLILKYGSLKNLS